MQTKTAAVVIIGNEILTGKTQDANAHFLIRELHDLGVALRRIVMIPDEVRKSPLPCATARAGLIMCSPRAESALRTMT